MLSNLNGQLWFWVSDQLISHSIIEESSKHWPRLIWYRLNDKALHLVVYMKINYNLDLKNQEDLRNSLFLLGVTPLWHVAQWVSRATTHHSLPAFLYLNGIIRPCAHPFYQSLLESTTYFVLELTVVSENRSSFQEEL